MADPWTTSFRSPSPLASSDEDRPKTPPYARLSREAELARELDLSSRDDRASFKPTPFTIAKAQAHYAAVQKAKKSLYRKISNSSSSSAEKGSAAHKGPIPVIADEVVIPPTTANMGPGRRNGPVPVIGAEALSKKPVVRNGWKMDSVWKTATNIPIPASAPPPKPAKAAKGKKKAGGGEGELDGAPSGAGETKTTAPLSRLETLLQGVDEHVAQRQAEVEAGKGKKGKAAGRAKAAPKRKKAEADEVAEGEEPPKKKRGGGRKKKVDKEEDQAKITFGRIPAGATVDSDYPIMQSLANQKKLPTKSTTSKSATIKKTPKFTTSKTTAAAKKATPRKKPVTSLSFLSDSSHEDVIASLSFTELMPTPNVDTGPGSKKIVKADNAHEEEDELINSDAEGDNTPEEEKEGKREVMSKFFAASVTASATTRVDEPAIGEKSDVQTPEKNQLAQDPPSTITHVDFDFAKKDEEEQQDSPNKVADTSSSQLPYSSPLAKKSKEKQAENESTILQPKPVRHQDIIELSEMSDVDGDAVVRLLEAQKRLAEKGERKATMGFKLPEPPKAAQQRRRPSPKSKISPLSDSPPRSKSPPSGRKPGFAQNGVFASQALKSGGVASAFGRHTIDPYTNPDYTIEWSTLRKLSKWAPRPSHAGTFQIAPLPSDFSRTGNHFKGGPTPPKPRAASPPAAPPIPVGGPQFRLKEVWTPSRPTPITDPREIYGVETNQGSRYGAAAEAAPNPLEAGSVVARGENGQPRFRVSTSGPTAYRPPPAVYGTHSTYPEPEPNWEDGWKMQSGGIPVQERMRPVPRLDGAKPTRFDQSPVPPAHKPLNRFAAPVMTGRFAAARSNARTRF